VKKDWKAGITRPRAGGLYKAAPLGSGFGPGDGDVGEVVGADPRLHEMDKVLLSRAKGGCRDLAQGALTVSRKFRQDGGGIDREKPAVIDQRLAGFGLRDPGAESDLVQTVSGAKRHHPVGRKIIEADHHAAPACASAPVLWRNWSCSNSVISSMR